MKTNYQIFKPENESENDKKAYTLLQTLIESNQETEDKKIVIDKNGDVHFYDRNLSSIDNIINREDVAAYVIQISDDKMQLHQLF